MKLRLQPRFPAFVLAVFALIIAVPVLAQDAPADDTGETGTNSVSFGGFSFNYPAELGSTVQVSELPGDTPDLEVPEGPRPPQVFFSIYDDVPEFGADYGPNVLHFYNTTDIQPYERANTELADLQNLLATDVDLVEYTQINAEGISPELPYVPGVNASQAIHGLPKYLEGNGFRGIAYLTVYRQDVSPFLADQFVYLFQGISDDGQYVISASFNVSTDLFEAETAADFDYEAFSADYIPYLNESQATLNSASSSNFTPSLDALDAVITSIALSGVADTTGEAVGTAEAGAQAVPGATAEPTNIVDAGFGGLASTAEWTLTGFGDPAAPTPRVPESNVAVSFSERGVTGNAGCNTFGGEFNYTNDGGLTITNVITTRMACEEPIMQQETAFLTALQSVNRFAVDDRGQLILFYNENEVERQLTFTSPEALSATGEVTPEVTPEPTQEITPVA